MWRHRRHNRERRGRKSQSGRCDKSVQLVHLKQAPVQLDTSPSSVVPASYGSSWGYSATLGHLHHRASGRNPRRSSASPSAEQRQAELKADTIPSAKVNSYSTSRHQHISRNTCLMPMHEVNRALTWCCYVQMQLALQLAPKKTAVVACIFLIARQWQRFEITSASKWWPRRGPTLHCDAGPQQCVITASIQTQLQVSLWLQHNPAWPQQGDGPRAEGRRVPWGSGSNSGLLYLEPKITNIVASGGFSIYTGLTSSVLGPSNWVR